MVEGVRLTIYGSDREALDSVCRQIREISKKRGVAMAGPVPLPTQKLRVPVRKGPDGCGTSTIDHWELRIHRRLIYLDTDERVLRQVMRVSFPDGIHLEMLLDK
ncbi:MAG: 30S ribosomal protein S10 [Thermoplasmata archaeon]